MISTNLLARITISLRSFKVSLENPLFWIGAVIILLFFLRWWGIKKFISFSIIVSILLFLMFKVDDLIISFFGKEEGNLFNVLTKPFFIFLIAFAFLYFGFIAKD